MGMSKSMNSPVGDEIEAADGDLEVEEEEEKDGEAFSENEGKEDDEPDVDGDAKRDWGRLLLSILLTFEGIELESDDEPIKFDRAKESKELTL